jgi:hypothetical protein
MTVPIPFGKFMERFEYKGYRVEIFAKKKGARWTTMFMVNGTKAKANGDDSWESPKEAARVAKVQACRFIDVHA